MKLLAIIRREYLERVKSKGFVISTLLIPFLMSLTIVVPMLMSEKVEEHHAVAVLDPEGGWFEALDQVIKTSYEGKVDLVPIRLEGRPVEEGIADIEDMIRTKAVDGGLVFGWLAGMASRDTSENMLWDLGYTEGYHTQPAISGDTVGAITRVLAVEDGPMPGTGILHAQFIGLKNKRPADVLEEHGEDLFIKENDKKNLGKEKISSKIFEIERKILLKKRPS